MKFCILFAILSTLTEGKHVVMKSVKRRNNLPRQLLRSQKWCRQSLW